MTRVASRETLLALKIAAGRKVDLRDVAVLAVGPVTLERVRVLLEAWDRVAVLDHLRQLEDACLSPDFIDSLKGVHMLDDRGVQGMLDAATRLAQSLRSHFLGT